MTRRRDELRLRTLFPAAVCTVPAVVLLGVLLVRAL